MENQVRALHIAECKITRVDGGRLGFEVSRLLAATLDHRPRATCVYSVCVCDAQLQRKW